MANTWWQLVIVISVVLCVAATLLEPRAFAQSPPPAAPAAHVASPHKSGKKKWIVIIAVAVGAAVAIALTQNNNQNDKPTVSPTITVGPPTIG